jgi:hypothetical protein
MSTANYPNGFPNGVTIRGVPITQAHPGKVFWVSNASTLLTGQKGGSDGNKGTFDAPFSTIDYAIGQCVANRGDIIFVKPGHVELITAASAIDLDVAGVALVGLGSGSDMPEIQFDNAAATVAVGADNVSINNINFNASVTGVTVGVNVEADVDYVTIEGCRFDVDATGTDEFEHAIRLVDGNIGSLIQGNTIHMGLGGAVAAIHLDADTSYTEIRKNYITGDYSTACIVGDTTLSTNILIDGNLLVQGVGGNVGTEPGIELLTGTTGVISNNNIVCNLATKAASIVADQCFLFENYYNEDVTGTGGLIGTASADD